MLGAAPLDIEAAIENRKNELYEQAVSVFHQPDLRNFVLDVRKKLDQVIDTHNLDSIRSMGWLSDQKADDEGLIQGFRNWVETRRDEVLALQIFYDQPYRRRELTYQLLKDLAAKLAQEQPTLALGKLWDAYARQDQVQEQRSGKDLVTLVSLIRRVLEIDAKITPYSKTVDKNFQTWLFKKQAGSLKFNKAQMDWLNLIKEHIANSVHLAPDDLDLVPFDAQGGRGKMWQLFGAEMDTIIAELNEALAA
jgi:type I restriction enzyme R subunit